MCRSTVPDSRKVLTHQHHIFRKTGTARKQNKTGMVAYLGGAHPPCGYYHHTSQHHNINIQNPSWGLWCGVTDPPHISKGFSETETHKEKPPRLMCRKMLTICRKNLLKWVVSISRDYRFCFEKVPRVRKIEGLFRRANLILRPA